MKPYLKLLLGLIALLVGLGFVMPAVSVVLPGLGLALAAAGVFGGVRGFRRLMSCPADPAALVRSC